MPAAAEAEAEAEAAEPLFPLGYGNTWHGTVYGDLRIETVVLLR